MADPVYIIDMEHGIEMMEDLLIGWVQGKNERSEFFKFQILHGQSGGPATGSENQRQANLAR
jgi:hypothetical protein